MSEALRSHDVSGAVPDARGRGRIPSRLQSQLQSQTVSLLRTLCAGLIAGGLTGFLVGGVLGWLVTREPTLAGGLSLAALATVAGALGGLVYLWVRRVLPRTSRAQVGLFGLFTLSLGGALLVNGYDPFGVSGLEPDWLGLSASLVLPLLYGLGTAGAVERLDRPSGWAWRGPLLLVLTAALAASIALPLVSVVTAAGFLVALGIRTVPALQRAWHSTAVTVLGRVLFAALVGTGVLAVLDRVLSVATGTSPDWPGPW